MLHCTNCIFHTTIRVGGTLPFPGRTAQNATGNTVHIFDRAGPCFQRRDTPANGLQFFFIKRGCLLSQHEKTTAPRFYVMLAYLVDNSSRRRDKIRPEEKSFWLIFKVSKANVEACEMPSKWQEMASATAKSPLQRHLVILQIGKVLGGRKLDKLRGAVSS